MSRRSSRNQSKIIEGVPYVNVIMGGMLDNKTTEQHDYWDVIEEMGSVLPDIPILKQIGGTCVPYSIRTAVQVANLDSDTEPPVCTSKMKKDGGQMRYMMKQLVNKNGDKGVYAKEYTIRDQKYNIIVDIIEELKKSNVVVAGGGVDVPHEKLYSKVKFRGLTSKFSGVSKVDNMVPVFNNTKSAAEHNICIIGCYNDRKEGPCFLTKMTNCREYPIKKIKAYDKYGSLINLEAKHLSYGILPIKYLQNGKFYLIEYATLPMTTDYFKHMDLRQSRNPMYHNMKF